MQHWDSNKIQYVVSVGEDSYQSRSKMNWSDPEFDQYEPKPWAQAEKYNSEIKVGVEPGIFIRF